MSSGDISNNARQVDDLDLLRSAGSGDKDALNEVLMKHRERLKRMVELRMNRRLQGRMDASDVIQEAFVEATREVDAYLSNPTLSVFLWLRHLAGQKLVQAHRTHLTAQKRSAYREQSMYGGVPSLESDVLAAELSGSFTSPSRAVCRQETHDKLTAALNRLTDIDREILTLKHFEQLSNHEVAEVVSISYEAVKKRYVRALEKLQKLLS